MTTQLNTIYNFRPLIVEVQAGVAKDLILPRILFPALTIYRMVNGRGHSFRSEFISGLIKASFNFFDIKFNVKTLQFSVTKKVHPELAMMALNITSIGLLYLNPYAVTIVRETKAIYDSAILLGNHVADKKYIDALKSSVSITDKCIFIASLLTGAPQLIVISIVSRSAFELYKSKQFYNKGMYFEATFLTAMAGLRCSAIAKTYQNEISEFVRL